MLFAAKIEDFGGADLSAQHAVGQYAVEELRRFLTSDYRHGVLLYGTKDSAAGPVAVWGGERCTDQYHLIRLPATPPERRTNAERFWYAAAALRRAGELVNG